MKFNCLSVLWWSFVVCVSLNRGIADASMATKGLPDDNDEIEDFIDLDDPFYHDNEVPTIDINPETPVTLKLPVTSRPDVNIQVEDGIDTTDDVIDADDDDTDEISGEGSGSGAHGDTASNVLNITTLVVTENPSVKVSPSTQKTEDTSTVQHDVLKTDGETTTRRYTLTEAISTSTATTTTSESDEFLDDVEEEGAADNSILDFKIKEGGDDEEEGNGYDVTKSPPTMTRSPSTQIPETTRFTAPVDGNEADSDVFTDPGVRDGSRCDDATCFFGAVCHTDGFNISCACVYNCSTEPHIPVCGSDKKLYRNSCHLRQTSCDLQKEITRVDMNQCRIQTSDLDGMCPEEQAEAYWSNWSPWVASGDVDVRFRSCNVKGTSLGKIASCNGPRIEVKSCSIHETGTCTLWNGTGASKFEFQCDGIDIRDTPNSDMIFGAAANEGECTYSLFDLKRAKMVFSQFSLVDVMTKGHIRKWCDKPDLFLVLSTPRLVCKRHLSGICKSTRKCKGSRLARRQRNLGDFAHKCWKEFIYGSRIPSGLSEIDSQYSFICQRFARDSKYGRVFGYKDAYFGTIFDTQNRIPVASLAKVSYLGDDFWPQTPFMVERGLVENVMTFTWFYEKQRGMAAMSDMSKCDQDWECTLGMKQSLPVDYEMSGYRIAHLVWPELINGEVDAKLSTFTLTNTAPMNPSLYTAWRQGIQEIRKYALNRCHIPTSRDLLNQTYHPELFVVSGAVPSANPAETIGNDVNVPFLFWTAACCVRDGHVESFAIYARNMVNSPVIVAPILQLETLLQDIYKVKPRNLHLKIFPAGEGKCGELRNDVSRSIDL